MASNKIIPLPPALKIKLSIEELLKLKELWHDDLLQDIPKSWEKYGDLVLFNGNKYFRNPLWLTVNNLWDCIAEILKVNRIALKYCIQNGTFRTPTIKMLLGEDTWVECKDNGIIYSWDIRRNMFCAGNAPERHRIAKLKCENEVVVDMYAGIGYFTLPFLLKSKVKLVHACEWNPNAVKALKLNLLKNKVIDRCIVYEGDCRLVCPKHVADRVNLGLLPSSESGWEMACQALNPFSGGTLHIHENVTSGIPHKHDNCAHIGANLQGQRNISSCETCNITLNLQNQISSPNSFQSFENCSTFYYSSSGLTLSNDVEIKWKKYEWKIWALHVCHKIWDMLPHNNSVSWKTSISFVHHVKSYAPHIDHLVADVKCSPSKIIHQL